MSSNRTLSNLTGGVSQQSPAERPSNTFEELENVEFSLVDGMTRRSGTDLLATVGLRGQLSATTWRSEQMVLHSIDRDETEKYLVSLGPVGASVGSSSTHTGQANLYVNRWEDGEAIPVYTESTSVSTGPDLVDPIAAYLDHRTEQILTTGYSENSPFISFGGVSSALSELNDSPLYFGYSREFSMNGSGAGKYWELNLAPFSASFDGTKNILWSTRIKSEARYPDALQMQLLNGATVIAGVDITTSGTEITGVAVAGTDSAYMDALLTDLGDGWYEIQMSRRPLEFGDVAFDTEPTVLQIRTDGSTNNGDFFLWGNMLLNEDGLNAQIRVPYVQRPKFVENLKLTTVGDTTFLLNTAATPAMKADLTPAQDSFGALWVRGYSEERTGFKMKLQFRDTNTDTLEDEQVYTVFSENRADGTSNEVGTLTPKSDGAGSNSWETPYSYVECNGTPISVAAAFHYQLTEDLSATSGWYGNGGGADIVAAGWGTVELEDNLVFITAAAGYEVEKMEMVALSQEAKYTWKAVKNYNGLTTVKETSFEFQEDSLENDQQVVVLFDTVSEITGLPTVFRNGRKVKLSGSLSTEVDDTWVEFTTFSGDPTGEGEWSETVAPEIPYIIDEATMPHQMQRLQDDVLGTKTGIPGSIYFLLSTVDWSNREVGDVATNRDPSFIGGEIRAIDVFEGRLHLVTATGGVLSRSSDLFDFWRSTTQAVPNDDRIDFTIEGKRAVDIVWAKEINRSIYMGGRSVQYVVYAQGDGEALTPLNIGQRVVREADVFLVEPRELDGSMFVVGPAGNYSRVDQILPRSQSEEFPTANISVSVPRYLDENLLDSAVSTVAQKLVWVGSSGDAFVYNLDPFNRQLGGWSKWTFGDRLLAVEYIQNTFFCLVDRDGVKYLESFSSPVSPSSVFLDFKQRAISAVYDGVDTTTFTFENDLPADAALVLDGVQTPVLGVSGNEITVQADVSDAVTATAGSPFTSLVTLSRPYNRRETRDGSLASTEEVVTVEGVTMGVLDTRALTVEVQSGATLYSKQYILPNISELVLGSAIPTDGFLTYPIGGLNHDIEVTLKTSLPFHLRFESIEWQLLQNTRRGWSVL